MPPNMTCEDSSNCFDPSTGFGVFCYNQPYWTNETNFCACSFQFGWIGESCDQPSKATLYYRASGVLFTLVSLTGVILILTDAAKFTWLRYTSGLPKEQTRMPGSLKLVGIATLLQWIAIVIYFLVYLPAAFDPHYFEINRVDVVDMGIKNYPVAVAMRAITLVFFTVATLQLSISWLDVTDKMSLFNKSGERWQTAIKAYRTFARVSTVLCLVVYLPMIILGLIDLMLLLTPIFLIVVDILIFIGRMKFIKLLSKYDNETTGSNEMKKSQYSRPLFLVGRSSFFVLLFCIIYMLLLPFYVVVRDSVARTVPPGYLNPELVLRDVTLIIYLCALSPFHWYFHNISKSLTQSMVSHVSKRNSKANFLDPTNNARNSIPKKIVEKEVEVIPENKVAEYSL